MQANGPDAPAFDKSASVTHNGACVSPSATTLHASGNSLVERLLENAADHRSLAYSLALDADAQRKRIASLERALKLIASGMRGDRVLSELELSGIASAALDAEKAFWHGEGRRFSLGQRVRKIKGSSWQGRIVGVYSTELTPVGYAVESEREPGSVQIYPEAALEEVR